jgi:hypothetical protein
MTASQFKARLEEKFPKSYFFSRNTMRFFGDTMKNYGVRKTVIDTRDEKDVPVYELYRRHPVKHGLQSSAYFGVDRFQIVFKIQEWEVTK